MSINRPDFRMIGTHVRACSLAGMATLIVTTPLLAQAGNLQPLPTPRPAAADPKLPVQLPQASTPGQPLPMPKPVAADPKLPGKSNATPDCSAVALQNGGAYAGPNLTARHCLGKKDPDRQ
jgi:hypothetical protein